MPKSPTPVLSHCSMYLQPVGDWNCETTTFEGKRSLSARDHAYIGTILTTTLHRLSVRLDALLH
jgi:hypothetical protein